MVGDDRRPIVFDIRSEESVDLDVDPQRSLLTPHFLVLCVSALFSALGFSSVIPTVARFVATELNGGDLEIGMALGVFSISAVLARPWIGRLGDRRGRRVLIAGGSLVTAVVLAGHALADTYGLSLIHI